MWIPLRSWLSPSMVLRYGYFSSTGIKMDSGDDVFVLMIDAAVMWNPETRTYFLAGIDKDGVTKAD